jgi:putative spermidine/putrescine transport system substrate-binding protein
LGVVPAAFAQGMQMPSSPVTINVVDVAGNLALTQDAMEEYAKKNPKARRQVQLHEGAGA